MSFRNDLQAVRIKLSRALCERGGYGHAKLIKCLLEEYSKYDSDLNRQLGFIVDVFCQNKSSEKFVYFYALTMQSLLEKGADPNSVDKRPLSASSIFERLVGAIDSFENHEELLLIDLFLKYGAKLEVECWGRQHSILKACKSTWVAEYLIAKGASPDWFIFVSTVAFRSDILLNKLLTENNTLNTLSEEEFCKLLKTLFEKNFSPYGYLSLSNERIYKIIGRLLDAGAPLSEESEKKILSIFSEGKYYLIKKTVRKEIKSRMLQIFAKAKQRKAELQFSQSVYILLQCYLAGTNAALSALPFEMVCYIAGFLGDAPNLAHRRVKIKGKDQITKRIKTINRNIDEIRGTRLIRVIKSGQLDEVNRLLDEGVGINWRDADGKVALYHAIEAGNAAIFTALMQRKPQLKDLYLTQSMLFWLGYFDRREWLKKLSPKSYNDLHFYSRLLGEAAKRGQTELMEPLLQKGADILWKNEMGETASAIAFRHKHIKTAIFLFESGDYPPVIKVLERASGQYSHADSGGEEGRERVFNLIEKIKNSKNLLEIVELLYNHLNRLEQPIPFWPGHKGNLNDNSFDTFLIKAMHKDALIRTWLFANDCPLKFAALHDIKEREKFRDLLLGKLAAKIEQMQTQPRVTATMKKTA